MSDQTPIEKAIEALKDAVDRIDNMVCAIDSGIHESELHDTAGDINDALAAIAAHVEAQRPSKVLTDEVIGKLNAPVNLGNYGDLTDKERSYLPLIGEAIHEAYRAGIRYARDNGLAPAQPLDPDAHITDQDAYLKAKRERAKDVDFRAIEAARVDPVASHMEHCRTLVDAQPDETLADAIERLMASQKSLSVDKTMEVVKEWLQMNGDDVGFYSAERDLRERLNKLLKTNDRE